MRGALDRRVFASVSHKVRHYCSVGRGRGRAAPSALPSPTLPPPTSGLGHGTAAPLSKPSSGAITGRGRAAGVPATRPIGETSTPLTPPPPPPLAKGRGRGDSPVLAAARHADATSVAVDVPAASASIKPAAKTKKVVAAKKTLTPTGVVSTAGSPQTVEASGDKHVVGGGVAARNANVTSTSETPSPTEQQVYQQVSQTTPQHASVAPGSSAPQTASAASSQVDGRSEVFAALINCCLARGLVHEIDYVHGAMRAAHVPLALQTCRALIDAYMRLGNLPKMDLMYMEMKQSQAGHPQPEASSVEKMQASQTLAAMINSWYSRGFFQEVDLAYRGLKVCHLPVPMQVYGAVMDAYSRLGNQGAVDMVYGEMRAAMAATQPPPPSPSFAGSPPGYGHVPGPGPQYQQYGQAYYPPPPQMHHPPPPVYTGYAPPQFQPMHQWTPASPYYAHPYMQPPQPPGYQPGYPGYPGYQPQYQQYQPPVSYAPSRPPVPVSQAPPHQVQPVPVTQGIPQVPPVTVTQVTAHQVPPAVPPRQTVPSHAPRPKLELQPKALELLQQSEYNKLLKQAHDRAAMHRPTVSTEALHAQVQHAQPYSVPQYGVQPSPQYQYPPPISPAAAIRPVVQPLPPQPSSTIPSQVIRPSGPAAVQKPVQPITPSSLPDVATRAAEKVTKPAATVAKTEAVQKAAVQVPSSTKADAKTVPAKVPEAKQSVPKPAETPERKAVPAKAAIKPESERLAVDKPTEVKPVETASEPSVSVATQSKAEVPFKSETGPKLKLGLKDKKQVLEKLEAPSTAAADKPEEVSAPPTLKLGLKDKKKAKTEAEAVAQPEEPLVKVSTLKLSVAGRGKGASMNEEKTSSPPQSPSLRLDLKKQVEQLPKQAEEDVESADQAESESSETEVVAALPSLRRKTARGRGKGLTTGDPIASILGVHTPADALLEGGLDDLELPSLPFEPRRGTGRGKAIPVVDPAAVAAEAKRVKLVREEQAARALAILESALGKSQMSVYLERRKKRLNEQQFSLGLGDGSRRRTEGRTGGTRKAKDGKQKAIQGEVDVDGAIEYIAPEAYMSKGDALTDIEEAIKGTLHRHFMLDLDPEAAMEEFGTNPDIDDKPLPTLEQTLEQAKAKLIAQDGIDEKQWEEAVEDVKKRAPQLESLVQRYTGPKKQNAKEKNKELHEIVSNLPPFAAPELAAFTKRAMRTLQNNPDWSQNQKTRLLHRLVWDTKRISETNS